MIKVIGSEGGTDANVLAINVINEPNDISFEKVDGESKEALENVKFGLYYEVPQYEEETLYTEDGTEIKVRAVKEGKLLGATDPNDSSPVIRTTDTDAKITFEGLPQRNPEYNLTEVKYYLKEIETVDGYQLKDTIYGPYTVTENGITGPDGKIINSSEILNPEPVIFENFKKPDLQITKVDSKDNSITLEGVEFELYKATTNGFETYNPKDESEATGIKQTTDSSGIATFSDIEKGVYWLKETIAPKDYVKNNELMGPYLVEDGKIYKVELDNLGKIIEDSKELLDKDVTSGVFKDTIENIKAIYPQTGGQGTYLYTIVGLALMCIAYIWSKRKEKTKSLTS